MPNPQVIEFEPTPEASWASLSDGAIVSAHGWYGIARGGFGRQVRDLLAGEQRVIHSSLATTTRLSTLAERGVLRVRGPRVSPPVSRSITVQGEGETAALIEDLLRSEPQEQPVEVRGIHPIGPCPPTGLAVVVATADEISDLPRANRCFLATGVPWILVDTRAVAPLVVGPLFVPGQTGCLECYWLRRSSAFAHPTEYGILLRSGKSGTVGPWARHMIAGLAATVAFGWLRAADPSLPGSYFEVRTNRGIGVRRHAHARVPACPACGGTTS